MLSGQRGQSDKTMPRDTEGKLRAPMSKQVSVGKVVSV